MVGGVSTFDELRKELDRVGVSYRRAGARSYAALHDLDDVVWIMGHAAERLREEGADLVLVARGPGERSRRTPSRWC